MNPKSNKRQSAVAIIAAVGTLLSVLGCSSHYLVPGGPASLSVFGAPPSQRDASTHSRVQLVLDKQPAANFPAALAVAQVQAPGYSRWNTSSYGSGNYSVVTVRESDHESDLARIAKLPMLSGVSALSRLLLPSQLSSDIELRQAAASLHADLLLIYTFDTTFSKDDFASPLTLVTLGLFPSKTVKVRTTASGLLMDTRSGYIYGTLESTSKPESQLANAWTSESAADDARERAEGDALRALIDEFERLWGRVVTAYSGRSWTSGTPVPAAPTSIGLPPPHGPTYITR